MKYTLKLQKNHAPKTYWQFTLIYIQFINSYQVIAFNLTILNIYFGMLYERKPFQKTFPNFKANSQTDKFIKR